jgi:hypothetical protein
MAHRLAVIAARVYSPELAEVGVIHSPLPALARRPPGQLIGGMLLATDDADTGCRNRVLVHV